jgi:hypothetical protein
MRSFLVVLLMAGLLFMVGASALAADKPETGPAKSDQGDPLVRALAAKGILTAQEAETLGTLPAAQQRDELTALLLKKGVISAADLKTNTSSNERLVGFMGESPATVKPAVLTTTTETAKPQQVAPAAPKAPAVVPAIAPLRVLQLEPAKPGGLIPDLKLGSKANLKIYGMVKASSIYDSSSPYGSDEPLPGFITSLVADTGPSGAAEYHVKARFARIGANFEWPDLSSKVAITGKLEADFEGNFTRVLNRNISTIRSNQFSLRLAWGRVDYKFSPDTNFFALFGQDWTPFGSSTLPNLFETTGLGLGFAVLYERAPQFRFGVGHNFGGKHKVFLQPEVAVVMPAYGDNPIDPWNQIYYGERQGADATRPDIQARLVTQWQLDPAPGVAPAQLIFSGVQGSRAMELSVSNIKAATTANLAAQNAILAKYPNGAEVNSERWGWTAELQLPTRYVTVLTKFWKGGDLRFYFVGNLLSFYNNIPLTTPAGTTFIPVANLDGTSSTSGVTPVVPNTNVAIARSTNFGVFGFNSTTGAVTLFDQRPFRDVGAFVNVSFPLGRILHAEPTGRNAGWQLHLHYGLDEVPAAELRRFGNGNVSKNDLAAATLYWKLNSLIAFSYEQSIYRSRTVSGLGASGLPLYRGLPARNWHDNRSEFGTIFTF